MIGQMAGLMPLTGAERLQRSSAGGVSTTENDGSGSLQDGLDRTSLSSAAVAMARNVPPAGESAEQRPSGPDEAETIVEKRMQKRIDIRV
jgi:hypothetical protein